MILVQKPPAFTSYQSPLYAHRRHPSTLIPTAVLPGLLTLSKPSLQPQNQRQIPKFLQKSKSTRAPLLNSPAEVTDNKNSGSIAVPASPSPHPHGRGQINHTKDRVQNQRSPSPSYPAVRRKHRHRPSPPIPQLHYEVTAAPPSDGDLSSELGILNPNVQDVFGPVNTFKPSPKVLPLTPIRPIPPPKRDSTSPSFGSLSKGKQSEREAAEKAAGYFASSMFQNSPSPEDLPDPLLF